MERVFKVLLVIFSLMFIGGVIMNVAQTWDKVLSPKQKFDTYQYPIYFAAAALVCYGYMRIGEEINSINSHKNEE